MFDCMISTSQVAQLTGATMRQLDYWCSTGLIRPATPAGGSGKHRRFNFVDVVRLKAIVRLLNAGIPLRRIRRALDKLDGWGETDPLTSGRLLALGEQLFWAEDDRALINILREQRALTEFIMLDLAEIAEETKREMTAVCAAA